MTTVGFNGEVNMYTAARWCPDLISEPLRIKFLRGKTKHFSKAEEGPNQFFWNTETEQFYYINMDKKRFRVEFIEETSK